MDKLIEMFNEFWNGEYVLETDNGWILFNKGHLMIHQIEDCWHELFFSPEYKWFEAMKWKAGNEKYLIKRMKCICAGKNSRRYNPILYR